jgi:F-type H+-transporting ATPase subunit epsilon
MKDKLSFEIITPDGTVLSEPEVDEVVFRRMEEDFEVGSEVAVFPNHGPMLARVPITAIRFHTKGRAHHVALGGGFIEVKNNRVRVITADFEIMDPDDPGSAARAQRFADGWRESSIDARETLVGYRR